MNKINAYTNFLYQNTLIFVTVKLKLVIFNFYDLFRKRKLLNLSEDEKELKRNGYLLSNFKINISKLNSFIEEKFKSNISGKNHWTRKDLSPEDFEKVKKNLIEKGSQCRSQVQTQSPNKRKSIENERISIEKGSQSRSQIQAQSPNERKSIENDKILITKASQSRSQAQSPNERKPLETGSRSKPKA